MSRQKITSNDLTDMEGISGPSGTAGIQGQQGIQGIQGSSGPSGTPGTVGAIGPSGTAGTTHAAVTVTAPIALSTQAISLVNDAAATITQFDTAALSALDT